MLGGVLPNNHRPPEAKGYFTRDYNNQFVGYKINILTTKLDTKASGLSSIWQRQSRFEELTRGAPFGEFEISRRQNGVAQSRRGMDVFVSSLYSIT